MTRPYGFMAVNSFNYVYMQSDTAYVKLTNFGSGDHLLECDRYL